MRVSFLSAVLCVSLVGVTSGVAQSRLLVVSQRDHTFHVYDPATLKELSATVEDEDAGHEVIATVDGKTAIVPIYGNAGVGRAGTDGGHLDLFDVATGKLQGTVPYGHGVRLHKPIYDPHTGMYLITAEIDKAITIYDPKTQKFVGTIPTGQEQSHMITLLPDGKKLYSANVGPGTVSVMDVPNRKLLKVIPISGNTQRISSSVDGKYVFTSDQKQPDLVVIDTAKDEVTKRITLPDLGYGSTPTPDGKYLLVTMDKQPKMAVIDLKTMAVIKTIDTPSGIDEMVVAPDSKTAYATSAKTDKVVRIDLISMTTTKVVDTGKFPDGLWLTK